MLVVLIPEVCFRIDIERRHLAILEVERVQETFPRRLSRVHSVRSHRSQDAGVRHHKRLGAARRSYLWQSFQQTLFKLLRSCIQVGIGLNWTDSLVDSHDSLP